MVVERLNLVKNKILVGIRLDGHAKELLDWALVKVADPGDSVVAIHVSRHSGYLSKERTLINGYLEDYEGLCSEKQVVLTAEVLRGKSIRKALVREAKKDNASAVIVGITKHSALGGWLSVAKYCAKRLPLTIEVMAVYNGRIVFSRLSKIQAEGRVLDPKPSIYTHDNPALKDNYSEFGESEISEISRFSFDGAMSSKDDALSPTLRRWRRGSLSSISLPPEDFTKQRPGWPLLQTSSLVSQPSVEARKKSVVQWVMSLPHRSLSEISEDSFEQDNEMSEEFKLARLPKDLEAILRSSNSSTHCEVFCLDVLKKSTSEFSSGNLIGKGGSNSVYKGILPQGKPVAVKIMESSKESRKQFIREVDIMATLKNKGITPLLGICVEDDNLMSVYDYISRGNLEDNLHGDLKGDSALKWEARFRIAIGIAEALNYLHNESPRPVIHRDVKSSNILLTDDLEPKLSDFGLAIWAPTKASFLTDSDVVGTFGYLAPEYFMYGKVSDKIDVYAFGVVLLELLSGKKPIGLETNKGQESLVIWAKPKLQNGDLKSILDPTLSEDIDETQMQRMAQAAALCLTQAARLRPKISQVLSILRGEECVDASESCVEIKADDDYDDEVYPDSSAESHLSLAFLDVNDSSASFSSSSLDQSNSPLSVEEYLKKRWSRASSLL